MIYIIAENRKYAHIIRRNHYIRKWKWVEAVEDIENIKDPNLYFAGCWWRRKANKPIAKYLIEKFNIPVSKYELEWLDKKPIKGGYHTKYIIAKSHDNA